MRVLVLLAVATVGVALAACGETPTGTYGAAPSESPRTPDLREHLTASDWLLDRGDSSLNADDASPVTLTFADATAAAGTAPCNTYRGEVELDDDGTGIRLDVLATTLMSCEPAVEEAEREYLDALARVRTADAGHPDRLVLTADGVRLSFTAIDPGELVVGDWALTGVRSGTGIQSVVADTRPVARFAADRSVVVETGCNTVRAGWRIEGRDITLEQPGGTLMECAEPLGVMEQETAIIAALTSAATVEITPAVLVLRDDAGDIVLTAARA